MKKNDFYDKINRASNYDSFGGDTRMDKYDPDYSSYDPDYATGEGGNGAATATQQARPGQKMQINLTISNPTAVKLKFELFSAFDSWVTRLKPELAVGAYTVIPALSTQGLATVGIGTVGYDQNGDLRVYGAMGNASASVGCGEYPYNSLVDSTKVLGFNVIFCRIAVQTNAQLNNQIVHFTRTFGGGYKQNQINVRAFKKPTQFQNLEVDTTAPFGIDGEKGLLYSLEIGEVVQLGLFINRWARPTM